MPARPEPKGARKCCCCIPIRGGIIILTWLYFFAGVAAAGLTIILLTRASDLMEITLATKAFLLASAALSILLALISAVGIFATIRLNPGAARLYYIIFYVWFLLQLALDIAVVVMFFTKTLDSLIPQCKNLTGRARMRLQRDCDTARNKMSWWYTVSMVVRSGITYYFVRRVASFSRHCVERAAGAPGPMSTPMAPSSTFVPEHKSRRSPRGPPVVPFRNHDQLAAPDGTVFACNLPTRPTPLADMEISDVPKYLSTPQPSPKSYQASVESIQGDLMKETPLFYNHSTARAV